MLQLFVPKISPKLFYLTLLLLVVLAVNFVSILRVHADSIDDCMASHSDPQTCIDLINKRISDLENALTPLKKESTGLQASIASAKPK